MSATADFFDEMAPRYDADLVELGWDPLEFVERWPFVVPAGAALLDAGCGTGALLERYAGADRELAGFDLSPGMLRQARNRRAIRGADLRAGSAGVSWPFPDSSFDRVVAVAMLEFVDRLDIALDELARVLRPGGRALFTVEDLVDIGGIEREALEVRYGRFPLWRRDRDELELSIPPGLELVRLERVPGYTVLERAFTCAYWAAEVRRVGP